MLCNLDRGGSTCYAPFGRFEKIGSEYIRKNIRKNVRNRSVDMMKTIKKILATILALAVVATMIPAIDARAEETGLVKEIRVKFSDNTIEYEDNASGTSTNAGTSYTFSQKKGSSDLMLLRAVGNGIKYTLEFVDATGRVFEGKANAEGGSGAGQIVFYTLYEDSKTEGAQDWFWHSVNGGTCQPYADYADFSKWLNHYGYYEIPDTLNITVKEFQDANGNYHMQVIFNVVIPDPTAPHTHNWKYGTIYDATEDTDGLEGYYCSCGATKDTSPIPSITAILKNRFIQMDQAGKGEVITLKMGEWNTFSKEFMQHLISATERGVTIKLDYKYEKKNYVTTIPAGTTMDLAYDYYGPLFIQSMFETAKLN